MSRYDSIALQYAERYGIITYKVKGNLMIFYKSYRAYLNNKAYSVKHTINLTTGVETTKVLKKLVREGFQNV